MRRRAQVKLLIFPGPGLHGAVARAMGKDHHPSVINVLVGCAEFGSVSDREPLCGEAACHEAIHAI